MTVVEYKPSLTRPCGVRRRGVVVRVRSARISSVDLRQEKKGDPSVLSGMSEQILYG